MNFDLPRRCSSYLRIRMMSLGHPATHARRHLELIHSRRPPLALSARTFRAGIFKTTRTSLVGISPNQDTHELRPTTSLFELRSNQGHSSLTRRFVVEHRCW